jgi:hypothetical protein
MLRRDETASATGWLHRRDVGIRSVDGSADKNRESWEGAMASDEPWGWMRKFFGIRDTSGASESGGDQGPLSPNDRYETVHPPLEPYAWAENPMFKAGYPPGWYDTTPREQTIEGNPALVVLRRDRKPGLPSDIESRGVIRCFLHGRAPQSEFYAAAEHLADLRARALQGRLVEPLRFVLAGGAPCHTFRVECTTLMQAFQSVPSSITEVHMFHKDNWLMMQLECDPKFSPAYQQVLATVLGTLIWK